MTPRLTLLILGITMICREPIAAAIPEKSTASESHSISEERVRALALYAPSPRYPLAARMKYYAGSGVALVEVDSRTGIVTGARMLESTGWGALDNAALETFRKWRFKPGTVRKVRIPVAFGFHRHRSWSEGAMYGVHPEYPPEARAKGLTGSGIVLVKIDPRTGLVASASMLKSTGPEILDNAALRAFRQWHFKPGMLTSVEIPVEFTPKGVIYSMMWSSSEILKNAVAAAKETPQSLVDLDAQVAHDFAD
jgi:TonB family protein